MTTDNQNNDTAEQSLGESKFNDLLCEISAFENNYTLVYKQRSKEWECHLYGSDGSFIYVPNEDSVPNWFWRKMHYLCFGNKWVRKNNVA